MRKNLAAKDPPDAQASEPWRTNAAAVGKGFHKKGFGAAVRGTKPEYWRCCTQGVGFVWRDVTEGCRGHATWSDGKMKPMEFVPFSEIDTLFVARELRGLQGKRVEGALRTGPLEVALLFAGGLFVVLSADARRYRAHRLSSLEIPAGPVTPLEQNLKGLVLHRVAVPRGERILFLEFTGRNRLGEPLQRVLVVELMGRYSQIVLLGPDRRILWTLKTVTARESRVRTLQVGGTWQPPPPKPWSLTDPDRNPEALRKHAPRSFPIPEGKDPVAFLHTYLQQALHRPGPGLFLWNQREIVLPAPIPGLPQIQPTSTVSEAWELLIRRSLAPPKAEEPPALARIRQELQKLATYERWNQVAEAILLHRDELLRRGRLEISLPDGTQETVELTDTPEALSARYRALAARWKRGYHKLQERLRQLASKGVQPTEPGTAAAPAEPAPARPYEVHRSPSGFLVFVGKNARGNEQITFSIASPDDYFFHARGVPGAHVVLKTGRQQPSPEDLMFAARLALQHSRAAADGKGEVSYTRVRYLKRPRRAPPGLVILTREQVLEVRL